jgi:hypothetical protein
VAAAIWHTRRQSAQIQAGVSSSMPPLAPPAAPKLQRLRTDPADPQNLQVARGGIADSQGGFATLALAALAVAAAYFWFVFGRAS